MYDAVRACLVWADISPERGSFKSHHGITAAFGLHLVKTGLFPVDVSKAFQRVQFIRQVADYEVLPVPHEDAALSVREAENFVAAATSLIAKPYQR